MDGSLLNVQCNLLFRIDNSPFTLVSAIILLHRYVWLMVCKIIRILYTKCPLVTLIKGATSLFIVISSYMYEHIQKREHNFYSGGYFQIIRYIW